MKKVIALILTLALLVGTVAGCAVNNVPSNNSNNATESNSDIMYEEARNYIIDYANAIMKAWKYGFNEDCIYENESIKDPSSSQIMDINCLAEVTGFTNAEIENVLHADMGDYVLSILTVNKYSTRFYCQHIGGFEELDTYNVLREWNGQPVQLNKDEYWAVIYNLEMVKLLFENIAKSKVDEILSQNETTSDKYRKLAELYEYVQKVHATCLDDDQFKYLFPDNYENVLREIYILRLEITGNP